jgi:hypothetical protein
VTHFICVGFDRRNEAEFFEEKCVFIGEFECFEGWDAHEALFSECKIWELKQYRQ